MQTQAIRQFLVTAGLTLCSLSDGFIFGQMSGMLDALIREDTSIKLTEDDIALIAALINVTCVCGYAVVGITTMMVGRRRAISILTAPVIICWIALYYAESKLTLILTRAIIGVSFGGVLMLCYICIGEYKSPSTRPFYLNFVTCVGHLTGTTLGHVLSLAMNWRHVALLGIIPSTASCIMPLLWVESPSWLASKGRYEESEKAFKLLHVHNEDTEKELMLLISTEKRKQGLRRVDISLSTTIKKIAWVSKQKYVWNIILVSCMCSVYRVAAGRVLFNSLGLSILRDLTGYSNLWGVTLLFDGLGILGAAVFSVNVRLFKRLRTLFFTFGIIGNLVLLSLSGVCFFNEKTNISDSIAWTKVSLLVIYIVLVNSGTYPVLDTLNAEIFPLEAKEFCVFIAGLASGVLHFLAINFASSMVNNIGYSGTFFLYAITIFLCFGYLWKYLPETKGKTLQEIELHYKTDYLANENNQKDVTSDSMLKDIEIVNESKK